MSCLVAAGICWAVTWCVMFCCCRYLPGSDSVLISSSLDGSLRQWDTRSGKMTLEHSGTALLATTACLTLASHLIHSHLSHGLLSPPPSVSHHQPFILTFNSSFALTLCLSPYYFKLSLFFAFIFTSPVFSFLSH